MPLSDFPLSLENCKTIVINSMRFFALPCLALDKCRQLAKWLTGASFSQG